jgi:transcriptional regulator with XRE-family HTH domain
MTMAGAPTDADRLRVMLKTAGLSQRAAAREVGINERTMRRYCGGEKVPRVVILTLERLLHLQRQVEAKK